MAAIVAAHLLFREGPALNLLRPARSAVRSLSPFSPRRFRVAGGRADQAALGRDGEAIVVLLVDRGPVPLRVHMQQNRVGHDGVKVSLQPLLANDLVLQILVHRRPLSKCAVRVNMQQAEERS